MTDEFDTSEENEDASAPTDDKDDDAFLRQVKGWFKLDREHWAEWRAAATEDFDFVAGHQWDEKDLEKLRDEFRPVITFNRIGPTVDSVTGLEISNRREVRFIPREQGDALPNEVYTAAAEWVRDECDAEDEETDAFFDTVVCGMGWTETRIDYEEGDRLADRPVRDVLGSQRAEAQRRRRHPHVPRPPHDARRCEGAGAGSR
jgi:hypothetical protein